MEHYNKTNKLKNFVKKAVIGISLVGLLAGNCTKKYEQASEIYQGWTRVTGKVNYVFDSKDFDSRVDKFGNLRAPKYILRGENFLRDSLEIGKKYCFEIESLYLPWAVEEIKSIREEGEK